MNDKNIIPVPEQGIHLTPKVKENIEKNYPIYGKAIVHHLEEAANCYYHMYATMLTDNLNPGFSEIDRSLNWDVIDEAKSHYKSALIRIDADIKRKQLKRH